MTRVYNFSPGPSMLPEEVLKKAASELVCYKDTGMSVMEMSHRSKPYEAIHQGVSEKLAELMNIPSNYKILFVQGGASTQFSMVPQNLMVSGKADYVVTGQFSKKAAAEAKKFGSVNIAASSEDRNNTYIPQQDELNLDPTADYLHICENNTIYGTKWNYLPMTNVPIVSDMSSCILSEPVDVSKYGLIYAGVQKNMGPAGMAVVIVREDLIGKAAAGIPTMNNYKTYSDNDSLYNTPPSYTIYMCGLVLDYVKEHGGLAAMQELNRKKAAMLYDYIDSSDMFTAPAEKLSRSIMNVPFVTGNADLDKKFIAEAASQGFVNIAGHRSVGGMRASIYNAMPTEGVAALVEFMKKFEKSNR